MATRRRRATSRPARRSRSGYGRPARRSTGRVSRAAPRATRSRGRRSAAPRQQKIVIEFAGATPVREMADVGLKYKPATVGPQKPRL